MTARRGTAPGAALTLAAYAEKPELGGPPSNDTEPEASSSAPDDAPSQTVAERADALARTLRPTLV